MASQPYVGNLFITQFFGSRPWYYTKYGLRGHNGLDFIVEDNNGKKIISPKLKLILPGVLHLFTDNIINGVLTGYGAAWKLDFNEGGGNVKQFTFAHLHNRRKEHDNKNLAAGVEIAQEDNTGDSSGEHTHITMKQYTNGVLLNSNNGFRGALDPLPFLKSQGIIFLNV